jgi:uncharacterized membrane protein YraQ (UPF0718 family)
MSAEDCSGGLSGRLAFGYAFSSLIQVLVPRELIARYLGRAARAGPKETALGMLLGPASSACSFAALSAGRALRAKGAALVPMMAFLFGSTNLGPPVLALAWIFLGWQFALALVLGAVVLVGAMALIVGVTYPREMVERARKDAASAGEKQAGMHGDPAEGLPREWRAKLRSGEAWHRIGVVYRGEWQMVWKDLLAGFVIAGVVATLVPDAVFQTIFPEGLSAILLVPIHALLGPVLALATIIGSMGNWPAGGCPVGERRSVRRHRCVSLLRLRRHPVDANQRNVLRMAVRFVPSNGVHRVRRNRRDPHARALLSSGADSGG